ncbi:hypothetical protein [Mycoplasma capricolum]|uniref:hypothetical protein n=1 Tax=Mycoplasma capricolum TaxID=2095 RepID=UPI00125D5BC4|nr:hypothetical protein [Mycoplasma capricolum]UVO24520.1 hypothetical protein zly1402F_03515 [Mycoplasma capricolum subsp. capripneumoniae]
MKKIILSYNQKLWFGHRPDNEINYLYIHKYANNLDFIIEKLKTYTKKGYQGYSNLSDKWLNKNNISSEEKKIIIQKIFRDTQVAFIYGSAGSGKTTLINYMSQIFNDKSKIFFITHKFFCEQFEKKNWFFKFKIHDNHKIYKH